MTGECLIELAIQLNKMRVLLSIKGESTLWECLSELTVRSTK